MPALAITEHGNMFSSIIFHDQARKRGINPILGCEVYVAPGDRRTKSGTPGETANHLVLLAETREGYHNLIKLVSSGYTEGFYYKPRIDKDLLAAHATGLIGLSSCLKGEVATGIRTEQMARATQAAATYRDILGAGNFFLEMQYQGIEDQRVVNTGLAPIARDLGLPLVVHQRRALPEERATSPAARHPALHRHGQDRQRRRPAALPRRPVLPEDRRGDGARSSATFRRRSPTRCGLPSAATSICRRRSTTCRTSTCPPASRSTTTSSTSCARGSSSGCRGCRICRRAACSGTRSTSTSGGSPTKSR